MSETPDQAGVILSQGPDGEIYLLQPDGEPGAGPAPAEDESVVEPAKVMRIGRMISRLLDEVKDAPLDDVSRARLREIYTQSIDELAGGLDAELADELRRITSPFAQDFDPTDAELRIAQAQLVGWLEGLFQGLQTALMAQQMAARAQVEQIRRAIPGRPNGPQAGAGDQAAPPAGRGPGNGLYL
jgi:hypothetical protein